MNEKIAVIGAGPAGIIAAGTIGGRGKDVVLIEKNEKIGKKLFITGKGRCNITNAAPIEEMLEYVNNNKNFLYSSFYTFTNQDIIELLEKMGLRTKVERGNRVFPASDKSSDVLKAFEKYLKQNNVRVMLDTKVEDITVRDNHFLLTIDNKKQEFDKIVIATGGVSYPATGSTGEGLEFARRMGHKIVPLRPGLVPIVLENSHLKEMAGVSLRNVKLRACQGKKLIQEEFGEMLFTHFGISGPIVLTISNGLNRHLDKKIRLELDLKPALDMEKLNNRIQRDLENSKNKQIKNALGDLLLQKLIPLVLEAAAINPEKPVNQLTREERKALAEAVKALPLKFKGLRSVQEGIVTAGGVSTKEINPSTMESKIVPGLFFAGEMIDVDANTGGYNLQIAYSTGYLAGMNI